MSFTQPTKGRIRSLQLAGIDLTLHVNKLEVYESISKPYITAKLTVIDNANLLENSQIVENDPCSFAFDGVTTRIYEQTLRVLSVNGQTSSQNIRSQIYQIELIGEEYYSDKGNLVQKSFKDLPGTQAIKRLHQEYVGNTLRVLADSLGPISREGYIISSKKPFTAIDDIRQRLTYGQVKSGNTLYFRDRDSSVLAPLELLFQQMGSQETFIQTSTVGKNWYDIATAENVIIAALATVDYNKSAGRMSGAGKAATSSQEKTVFDIQQKRAVVQNIAKSITPGQVIGTVTGLITGKAGRHGGLANYMITDNAHLPLQIDPSMKTEAERLYREIAKSGPVITIKVPIQSGINCTVGKGATLNLLPPMGDVQKMTSDVSGQYLITDLCHSLAADDRMMNATTTMQCMRGGRGD